MLILLIWAIALGFGLVVLAILGYGVYGQLTRLRKAAAEAAADVRPKIEALRPAPSNARHRA